MCPIKVRPVIHQNCIVGIWIRSLYTVKYKSFYLFAKYYRMAIWKNWSAYDKQDLLGKSLAESTKRIVAAAENMICAAHLIFVCQCPSWVNLSLYITPAFLLWISNATHILYNICYETRLYESATHRVCNIDDDNKIIREI